MTRTLLLILAGQILLLFGYSAVGCAATYYVDQRHKMASDANPGSIDLPWETIGRATAVLQPGDTVYVRAGEYRELVTITKSGQPGREITYSAYPGETVVIKGSVVLRGFVRDTGAIWKYTGVTGKLDLGDRVWFVIQEDGPLTDAIWLERVNTKEDMREGTFYLDAQGNLLVWLFGDVDPNTKSLEAGVRTEVMHVNANYIRIKGFQMRHTGGYGAVVTLGGEYNTLEENIISFGSWSGVNFHGRNKSLIRNVVAFNGRQGLGAAGYNFVLDGNELAYNNVYQYNPDWHGGGAKLIGQVTLDGKLVIGFNDSLIRGTHAHHNFGPGIWLDGQCRNNIIENGTYHDNQGPGLMVEISEGNIIRNNISYSNRHPLGGFFREPTDYAKWQTTMAVELKAGRFWGGDGFYISSAPQTKFYNNLAYNNAGFGVHIRGRDRNYSTGGGVATTCGIDVRNNILVGNHQGQMFFPQQTNAACTNTSDYNVFWGSGPLVTSGPAAGNVYGTQFTELAQWRTRSGQDRHSLAVDPLFSAPFRNDFRLLPQSKARGAGVAIDAVDVDRLGKTRVGILHPDIGPFQQ